MKKCPKTLAAAMAVAMIATMGSGAVFAEEAETPDTESTTVKYTVKEAYEWSIHSEIDFGESDGTKVNTTINNDNNTVKVTKNVISDGKTLNISVKGSGTDGAFEIANGNTKLTYTIADGSTNISNGGTVLDVVAGTNEGSKDLTFTLTTGSGTAEVAGSYTGTVTYTASIK